MIKLETIAQRLRHVGSLCTLCMALAASLMVSCVHDKDMLGCPEGEPGTLTLQFKVAGTTAAPAGAATRATLTGENRVDDIAVWLLEKDGDNKCLSFHYIKAEDQSPAEQAKWEAGDFSVKLSGVPPFETVGTMFVTANVADNFLGGVPTSQVGKMPKAIFEGCITKSSHTIPIGTPLPMGVFTAFDNDNALVSPYDVSLGRTVARIKVNLKVDPTNADLAGKFDLAGAKVTLSNFVEHGIAFFRRNAPSTAGVAFDCFQYEDKSITVKYHDEERNFTLVPGETDRVNVAPLYLNQRSVQTFRKDVTDEYDPDRKVTALLHVPYKKNVADADWLQDNYYKVDIYNADESQGQYSRYFIHPNRSYNLSLTIIGLGSDGLKAVIDCVPWDVVDIDKPVGQIRVESKYDVCDVYVSNNTDFTLTDLKPNVDIKVTPPEGYQLISPVDGIVYTGTTTPIILRGNVVTLNQSISLKITDVKGTINIASPISFTPYASTLTSGYNYVDISGGETFHSDNWRDVEFTNGLSSTYSRATAVTDLVANSGVRCHFNGNLTNKTKIIAISSVRNGANVGRIYSQPAGVALLSYQRDADGVYISSVSPINLGVYINAMAYDVAMTSQKGLELKGNIISQTGSIEGEYPGVVDYNNQSHVTLSFKRSESNVANIISTFFFNRVKFNGLIYIDRNSAANTPQASGYSYKTTVPDCPAGYRRMTNAEAESHAREVKAVNGYVAKTLTQYAPRIAQWTESKSGNVIYWSKTGSTNYAGLSQSNWTNRDVVAYSVTLEGLAFTIDSRDIEGGTSGSRLASEVLIQNSSQVLRCLKSPK